MASIIHCPHCHREIQVSDALDHALQERLKQEGSRIESEAHAKARESLETELRDLQEQLSHAQSQITHAQEQESLLRKERRAMEERQREAELTLQRRLDDERSKIRDEAKRQADEEYRLKEADHDKHLHDLRQQIVEMKRRAELGIPSIQGEVAELDLEEFLRCQFPQDDFEPVPAGVHGGDLIQRVRDAKGQFCGTLLWESKRTKNWNESWLAKLRKDQMEAHADLAILLTAEAPKHLTTFGCVDGIWITKRNCLEGLAVALRCTLIEVARTRRSAEGRQSKAENILGYLDGPSFRLKIETIVQAYHALKDDLNTEKRAHYRSWAKREKQLDQAIETMAALVGDLDGILGSSMHAFPDLSNAMIELEATPILAEASPF